MVLRIQSFLVNLGAFLTTLARLFLLAKWRVGLAPKEHSQCVLLGNGPSFKGMIRDHAWFLQDKDIICVNHFPSTEFYQQLKPRYFVTSAPDLWLDDIDEFFVNQSNNLFENIRDRTQWPLIFYIPYEARKFSRWQNILKPNPNIRIVYYNNTPVEGWKWFRHFCFRKNWGMPRPHNVFIPCITLTLNMGYSEIYLWGADHSWLSEISVAEDNRVLINQKHFYDYKTSVGKPLDKRGVGERNLPELLTKFVYAFRGYFILREYAESLGSRVLNATPGSFIDAFDRINLKEHTIDHD